jgi:putative aldouronate transport system permease protein
LSVSKKSVANYVLKTSVILLFFFTFIGFINPARISKHIDSDVSLLKSVFYFKSFSSGFVEASKQSATEEDSAVAAINEITNSEDSSMEDYYAALANLMNEGMSDTDTSVDMDFSLDTVIGDEKAEKIKLKNYKQDWDSFSVNNEALADVVSFDRFACILTFMAIALCIVGIYLACDTGIIRKIGFIVVCVGAVGVSLSMVNYVSAYSRLSNVLATFDVMATAPKGIPLYIIFSVLAFASALLLLIWDKNDTELKAKFSVTSFQVTYRVLSLVLFIFLFIPALNPARISDNISRNVSLFTSGFAYGTYTKNIERALIRGWLPYYVINIAFFSSMIACIGIIACGLGSCVSVGNNKLKRYAHIALIAGSSLVILSMFGILYSYNLICSSPNVNRLAPIEPAGFVFFVVLAAIILICSIISFIKTPAPEKDEKCHIDAPLQLFLMILPFLILVFIFSYLPLWGWRYAFFDYSAGDVLSMENWVGFKWFKAPFENAATRSDIIRVLKNTLAMSGLGILTSWCPMFFAIFLAEIRNTKVRRVIQTLTTIPNFISWVLVYAIAFCIFGTEGFISSLMVNNGFWDSGKNMLMGENFIWVKMLLWGMWKSLGWSAIMYIAAISGIDQELYEAATVDGAGRFQKMMHITLPELFPTYIVLLILSVSNILSNGMDQYLVFKNSTNKGPIEVLDLYVYQLTFGSGSSGNIPFSTVVSMFKSFVSVVLLFITNKISKWIRGTSIF